MKNLPNDVTFHSRTPEFDQDTVPAGLLGQHTTAQNVWGRIRVSEGRLVYRTLEPNVEEYVLDPDNDGIVAPQAPHQVVINGAVKFRVEFFRKAK